VLVTVVAVVIFVFAADDPSALVTRLVIVTSVAATVTRTVA
jgi:hypothetical protein